MKITIKQLRKVVNETIKGLVEAKDNELSPGDVVSVFVNGERKDGKIIGSYVTKCMDPMAKGKNLVQDVGHTMWTVDVNNRIYQVPSDEIELISSKRDKGVDSKERPVWKTDMNVKKTQEAVAIRGMSTMLKGGYDAKDTTTSDKKHHDKEEDRDDKFLLDVDKINEVDEEKEVDDFDERRYDTIAKQLVINWDDRDPGANWKAIAKSYANAKKASSGKTINPGALYKAILKFLETDGDERNQAILGGTHFQFK